MDAFGGPTDRLWPRDRWFPLRLDRPLATGARGGHGPVRYTCVAHGQGLTRFAFRRILGSDRWRGEHRCHVTAEGAGTRLTHVVEPSLPAWQRLQWAVLVGPLHDAVLEDLLDRAAAATGTPSPAPAQRTPWVRLLRRLFPQVRNRD